MHSCMIARWRLPFVRPGFVRVRVCDEDEHWAMRGTRVAPFVADCRRGNVRVANNCVCVSGNGLMLGGHILSMLSPSSPQSQNKFPIQMLFKWVNHCWCSLATGRARKHIFYACCPDDFCLPRAHTHWLSRISFASTWQAACFVVRIQASGPPTVRRQRDETWRAVMNSNWS